MWRKSDLDKLRGRSTADRQLLVEAMLWLGIARSAILTIPFRWTTRLFALKPGEAGTAVDQSSRAVARRIGWALRAASGRSPWHSTCLAQALAGTRMLRRRGIPGTLTMGVARSTVESSGLEAHAWLSCSSVILTGADGCERYRVIAKFTLNLPCEPPQA
jgi:hypothetical protein